VGAPEQFKRQPAQSGASTHEKLSHRDGCRAAERRRDVPFGTGVTLALSPQARLSAGIRPGLFAGAFLGNAIPLDTGPQRD
jgi:hypothetical protein